MGSFSRDPGPEFPGNGNAKIPGIPGNFPSRDSRPTALVVPTGVVNDTKCEMSLPSVLVTFE